MYAKILSTTLTALLLAACSRTEAAKPDVKYSPEEMQAKWMEFATPGPAHHVLDAKVGQWDAQVTMYEPDGKTTTSSATSEMSWMLDGRYLVETVNGSFEGMPFQGRGLTGYDNIKKCYVGSWIDNMGTGITTSEGTYDAARKTFTFRSESPDVMQGRYTKARSLETIQNSDHFKVEMWNEGAGGKETKMMELLYTRRK